VTTTVLKFSKQPGTGRFTASGFRDWRIPTFFPPQGWLFVFFARFMGPGAVVRFLPVKGSLTIERSSISRGLTSQTSESIRQRPFAASAGYGNDNGVGRPGSRRRSCCRFFVGAPVPAYTPAAPLNFAHLNAVLLPDGRFVSDDRRGEGTSTAVFDWKSIIATAELDGRRAGYRPRLLSLGSAHLDSRVITARSKPHQTDGGCGWNSSSALPVWGPRPFY